MGRRCFPYTPYRVESKKPMEWVCAVGLREERWNGVTGDARSPPAKTGFEGGHLVSEGGTCVPTVGLATASRLRKYLENIG